MREAIVLHRVDYGWEALCQEVFSIPVQDDNRNEAGDPRLWLFCAGGPPGCPRASGCRIEQKKSCRKKGEKWREQNGQPGKQGAPRQTSKYANHTRGVACIPRLRFHDAPLRLPEA